MEVINVTWFSEMGCAKPIGIVVVEVEEGERKAYIGTGDGYNEQLDTQHIISSGAKLHPATIAGLVRHMKLVKE